MPIAGIIAGAGQDPIQDLLGQFAPTRHGVAQAVQVVEDVANRVNIPGDFA
jgi:hypothetical protein